MNAQSKAAVLAAMIATTANAQSLNIDVGDAAGVPSASYAAAGLPGVWNLATIDLVGLDGEPIAATLNYELDFFEFIDDPGTTGDDELLLDDYIDHIYDVCVTAFHFDGLANGTYDVITYAWRPSCPDEKTEVSIGYLCPQCFSQQTIGGTWPGELQEGVTHARHTAKVTDGTLDICVYAPWGSSGSVNGLQLVELTDCNENGVADWQDIQEGTSADCDDSGVPDECQPYVDCNANGMQDICDLATGTSGDCNRNLVPDECDIADKVSNDDNETGIPDECESAVLFVNAQATGGDYGTTWEHAYPDLQDALTVASNPENAASEVWVASGWYTPDRGTDDRGASFDLINGVAIYGGFAGWENSVDQRDFAANETILSGDLAGDDTSDSGGKSENSYHVVVGSNTDATAILDGFTISGGNADRPIPLEDYDGGGLLAVYGSPTIANCWFKDNRADGKGGAIYTSHSTLVLEDCIIEANSAPFGGGMANIGPDSDPLLSRCTFIDNSGIKGGGMHNDKCHGTFVDCTFVANGASYAGGGMFTQHGGPGMLLINCVFDGNGAGTYGGGIYNQSNFHPTLVNCLFIENTAGEGGGVYNSLNTHPTLVNCTLHGNSATLGGGMLSWNPGGALLTNCIVWDNFGGRFKGIRRW